MSQKLNRARNRLRIEQERSAKRAQGCREWQRRLEVEAARLAAVEKSLNRSVALRMRVRRDFERPMGEAFALNIVIYPHEYLYMARMEPNNSMLNVSHFAGMHGREAGHKIAEVIQRCLTGELEEFAKAR